VAQLNLKIKESACAEVLSAPDSFSQTVPKTLGAVSLAASGGF